MLLYWHSFLFDCLLFFRGSLKYWRKSMLLHVLSESGRFRSRYFFLIANQIENFFLFFFLLIILYSHNVDLRFFQLKRSHCLIKSLFLSDSFTHQILLFRLRTKSWKMWVFRGIRQLQWHLLGTMGTCVWLWFVLKVKDSEGWIQRLISPGGSMWARMIGSGVFLGFMTRLIHMTEYLVQIVSNYVLEDMHLLAYFHQSIQLRLSILFKFTFRSLFGCNKFT